MKVVPIAVVGLTPLGAAPSTAFALGMESFGNGAVVSQSEWAPGIVNVVNLPSGVYSVWVNLWQLRDADSTVCSMAVHDLASLAPYREKVVPALTDMLKPGKDDQVRRAAAACLGHIGAPARSAVPALQQELKGPVTIRTDFASAIAQLEKAKDKVGAEDEARRRLGILQDIHEFQNAAGGSKP